MKNHGGGGREEHQDAKTVDITLLFAGSYADLYREPLLLAPLRARSFRPAKSNGSESEEAALQEMAQRRIP